tara:strand:+ start:338 stop:730 length:393 start_codon:yes stop_codon:yes gene_type:complete
MGGFIIKNAWQSEVFWEDSKESIDGEQQVILTHFEIDVSNEYKVFGIKNYVLGHDIDKSMDYIKSEFYFTDLLEPIKNDSLNKTPVNYDLIKSNNQEELEENLYELEDTILFINDNWAMDWWEKGEKLDI